MHKNLASLAALSFASAIRLNRAMHAERLGMPQFEFVEYDFDQYSLGNGQFGRQFVDEKMLDQEVLDRLIGLRRSA